MASHGQLEAHIYALSKHFSMENMKRRILESAHAIWANSNLSVIEYTVVPGRVRFLLICDAKPDNIQNPMMGYKILESGEESRSETQALANLGVRLQKKLDEHLNSHRDATGPENMVGMIIPRILDGQKNEGDMPQKRKKSDQE